MSRKKGVEKNSGKDYTVEEYNLIFWLVGMGVPIHIVARVLKRNVSGIERAWDRLCVNGTDYPNKKLYVLKDLMGRGKTPLTGPFKEYIQRQWTEVEEKTSIKELSERTGIPERKITNFIETNEQFWKKKPKNELFLI